MPTQRPYFSNFLAAFRMHHAIKSSSGSTTATQSSATTFSQTPNFSANSPQQQPSTQNQNSLTQTNPTRPIPTKTSTGLAGAAAAFSPPSTTHHTHARHASNVQGQRSPSSPLGGNASGSFPSRTRRGSDSSSDGGFKDALGGEKWFIGGRTATGEERFYNLSMVRRDRSGERASVDRMSL